MIADFPGLNQSVLTPDGKLSQARVRAASRAFAEQSLLTESDRMRLTQLRWRGLMPRAAGLGIMSGILQYVALGKLADDLDKSMT